MPSGTRPGPLPSTARVAISGTIWGHRWVNVFWLNVTHSAAVTVNDLKSIADGIDAAWAANVAVQLDNHAVMNQVDVAFFPTSTTEVRYTGSYNRVGGQASQLQDAAACVVVVWIISAFYRGGKPRSYLPGVRADQLNNGSDFTSAFVSTTATGMNNYRNAVNALTSTNITAVTMGTLSFIHANAYRAAAVFYEYTSVKIRSKLGTQRRRILS